mgnify:CR=1 FL=1
MNILVCIKQVPDDSVEIHLNAEGTPDLANVTPVVNARNGSTIKRIL